MLTRSDIDALVRGLTDIQRPMNPEPGAGLELARTYHNLGMTPDANRRLWNAAVDCLRRRFQDRL